MSHSGENNEVGDIHCWRCHRSWRCRGGMSLIVEISQQSRDCDLTLPRRKRSVREGKRDEGPIYFQRLWDESSAEKARRVIISRVEVSHDHYLHARLAKEGALLSMTADGPPSTLWLLTTTFNGESEFLKMAATVAVFEREGTIFWEFFIKYV
ncbi:hypothetical protein TIFTF001_026981 [Ficus carica]|uniref:Uncharacterized protein n=1 Tax=Ficus carica TaxID=3494 RepID=A0AA88DM89_FICCA|nr:hypothetical protein TIFTF001_026981 [Ficus carica]